MKVIIRDTKKEGSVWAARHIVEAIKWKASQTDRPFVLGLPTGSTPLDVYAELIKMYKAGEVSFKNVITFNMDEYVNLPEARRKTSTSSTAMPLTWIRSAKNMNWLSWMQAASTFSSAESAKTATSHSTSRSRP